MSEAETIPEKIRSDAEKKAYSLVKGLKSEGRLYEPSLEFVKYLVSQSPLSERQELSESLIRLRDDVGKLKYLEKSYLENRESAALHYALSRRYEQQSDPQKAEYHKRVWDLNRYEAYKARQEFIDTIQKIVYRQEDLSSRSRKIPKPDKESIKRLVGIGLSDVKLGDNILVTLSIAAIFGTLFTLFVNSPKATTYAILPSYGPTYILLSIVVFAALVLLFKKMR